MIPKLTENNIKNISPKGEKGDEKEQGICGKSRKQTTECKI